jgi:hypothetical protein
MKLILTTAVVGMALAVPSVSNAAPPPPVQDSVVLTDAPGVVTPPNRPSFSRSLTSTPQAARAARIRAAW